MKKKGVRGGSWQFLHLPFRAHTMSRVLSTFVLCRKRYKCDGKRSVKMRSSTLVVRRVKYAVDLDLVNCSLHVKCRPRIYRYFLNFATQSTLSCIWQNIPIYAMQQLTLKQVCQTSGRPGIIDRIPEKNIQNKCGVCFPFGDAAAVGWNPK